MNSDPIDPIWPPGQTLGWTVVLFIGFLLGQTLGILIAHFGNGVAWEYLTEHPWGLFWATAGAVPVVFAGVWAVIRLRSRLGVSHYLGLRRPRLLIVLLHLVLFAPFVYGLGTLIDHLNGGEPNLWMLDILREPYGRYPLWIAIAVLAPLQEEWLFRGFYYRGIAGDEKVVRPLIAIVSGALIFTFIHGQYDLVEKLYIFGLGIAFGLSRWHSGSLWTPILLHTANNAFSLWGGYRYLETTGG